MPESAGPAPRSARREPTPEGSAQWKQETNIAKAPLGFLEACREHYRVTVRDYRCLFLRRERIGGELSAEEHIRVRFREEPFSVDLRWIENARRAVRVTYVEGRCVEDGRKMAHIIPAGFLGLLAPQGVMRDIHGNDMARDSGRPIDQFGYDHTLRLIIEVCRRTAGHEGYRLRYAGRTDFHGRACYHLERRLPYTPGSPECPNRLLDIFIDEDWLIPIGCIAYADDGRESLLGSYLMVDPKFNVGLTDKDFGP